ncbi:ATP-binding protein [bacterium]|nr:ATP-binding protein [bacterium]
MTVDIRDLFTIRSSVDYTKAWQFANRLELLDDCLKTLAVPNSQLLIYGESGVGKSSLGRQLFGLLNHRSDLFTYRNYKPLYTIDPHTCIWFNCHELIETDSDLILSLLRDESKDSIKARLEELSDGNETLKQVKDSFSAKFGGFGYSHEVARTTETIDIPELEASHQGLQLFHDFKNIIHHLTEASGFPLVIFLDEFHQVGTTDDFARIIKNLREVKFVFIGTSETFAELLQPHRQIARLVTNSYKEVPGILEEDVRQFFRTVEENSQNEYRFDDEFLDFVVEYSDGYPWLMQQFGYFSLEHFLDQNRGIDHQVTLTRDDLFPVIPKIAEVVAMANQQRLLRLDTIQANVIRQLAETPVATLTNEDLRTKLPSGSVGYFDSAVDDLLEQNVLRSVAGRLLFVEPMERALVKALIATGQFASRYETK